MTEKLQLSSRVSTIGAYYTAIGDKVVVCGWIATCRQAGKGEFAFIHISDGMISGGKTLQIVCDANVYQSLTDRGLKELSVGASIYVEGIMQQPENKEKEVKATRVVMFGSGQGYPIAKKTHTLEYLRTNHRPLLSRTKYYSSVARIRNSLIQSTHRFFSLRKFMNVHTPILTSSDCEGAGEMFTVVTVKNKQQAELNAKYEKDQTMKDLAEYTPTKFFGKKVGLTVSGQLCAELFACGMSNVYTFGPTFRAENSNTSRHLAEFWMVEPEVAFADCDEAMDLAENYVRFCVSAAINECADDIQCIEEFHASYLETKHLQTLKCLVKKFARVSYTDAIDILFTTTQPLDSCEATSSMHWSMDPLLTMKQKNPRFEDCNIYWGMDLASEHEKYLAKHFDGPVFIYDYPKAIKSFYMRANDDCEENRETVAAFDLIVPGIGELIGGSQREERYDVLVKRMEECGLDPKEYKGYLDTRKYGTVPHSGFGLGFERLVMMVGGVQNIRDSIPFPRYPKHCEY